MHNFGEASNPLYNHYSIFRGPDFLISSKVNIYIHAHENIDLCIYRGMHAHTYTYTYVPFLNLVWLMKVFHWLLAGEVKDLKPISSLYSLTLTFLLKLKFCVFRVCLRFGISAVLMSIRPHSNVVIYWIKSPCTDKRNKVLKELLGYFSTQDCDIFKKCVGFFCREKFISGSICQSRNFALCTILSHFTFTEWTPLKILLQWEAEKFPLNHIYLFNEISFFFFFLQRINLNNNLTFSSKWLKISSSL